MRRIALLVALAIACFGCRMSTRSITSGNATIAIHPPTMLAAERSFFPTFSRDGRYYSAVGPEALQRGRGFLEVRDADTLEVVYKRNVSDEDLVIPLLFSTVGERVICLRDKKGSADILTLDYRSGVTNSLIASSDFGGGGVDFWRNADQTLAIFDGKHQGILISSAENVIVLQRYSKSGFDTYGAFWALTPDGWLRFRKDGSSDKPDGAPGALVRDQSKTRGRLVLSKTEQDMSNGNSSAHVSAIWLQDPRTPDDDSEPRAALVDVCAEVFDFGFVPNRRAIWITTWDMGTRLVPYTSKPK